MNDLNDRSQSREDSMIITDPKLQNEKGAIQIWNNVLASIIKKYLAEIDGVVRPAPQSIFKGLADMISPRNYESNIVLEMTEEQAVVATVSVILRFGVNVPEVCRTIQNTLFDKLQAFTGCTISKVNVIVVDLEEVEPEQQDENTNSQMPVQPGLF